MRVRVVQWEELGSCNGSPWRDPGRRIFVDGDNVYVPVRDGFPCDRELPERRLYRGRGYQRLGSIIVIHGSRPTEEELNSIVAWAHPRGILWMKSIDGVTRIPIAELLYGTCRDVCHRENGCRYWFDPSRIMFAQGNRMERARMGRVVRERGRTERVADICAGIGYFTIPMARAGAMVHAMEISPVTFQYLLHTIGENHLSSRVEAACGDSRTLLTGSYDRFVIGHFDSLDLLPAALRHADTGSILHVHTTIEGESAIRNAVASAGFSATLTMHRIKKYAPHRWHTVWDVVLA